jgi:hypothetical protein
MLVVGEILLAMYLSYHAGGIKTSILDKCCKNTTIATILLTGSAIYSILFILSTTGEYP